MLSHLIRWQYKYKAEGPAFGESELWSKQACKKSEDGYKNISKSLNIHWSTIKSIIKQWKEYDTVVNVPREDKWDLWQLWRSAKLQRLRSERLWYHNSWPGASRVTALWENRKKKATVKRNSWHLGYSLPEGTWETLKSAGRRFDGCFLIETYHSGEDLFYSKTLSLMQEHFHIPVLKLSVLQAGFTELR